MIGLFWNIRGLGKLGRVPALVDSIRKNHVDFVGVVETKKKASLLVFLNLSLKIPHLAGATNLLEVQLGVSCWG